MGYIEIVYANDIATVLKYKTKASIMPSIQPQHKIEIPIPSKYQNPIPKQRSQRPILPIPTK